MNEVYSFHMRIDYKDKKTWQALGKNGYMHQDGLEVWWHKTIRGKDKKEVVVRLYPITSRNEVGTCLIEIPISSLPQLIKQLSIIKKGLK